MGIIPLQKQRTRNKNLWNSSLHIREAWLACQFWGGWLTKIKKVDQILQLQIIRHWVYFEGPSQSLSQVFLIFHLLYAPWSTNSFFHFCTGGFFRTHPQGNNIAPTDPCYFMQWLHKVKPHRIGYARPMRPQKSGAVKHNTASLIIPDHRSRCWAINGLSLLKRRSPDCCVMHYHKLFKVRNFI